MRKVILLTVLALSLGCNLYLFKTVVEWQDVFIDQFVATYNIERLYINSGADLSFSSVQSLAADKVGTTRVIEVDCFDRPCVMGIDKVGLETEGVVLIFKDGLFAGTKSRIPDHLSHWGFGVD